MKIQKRHEKKANEILRQAEFIIEGMNHESEKPLSLAMWETLEELIAKALQETEIFGNENDLDVLDDLEDPEPPVRQQMVVTNTPQGPVISYEAH